jgi:hypothetical protein
MKERRKMMKIRATIYLDFLGGMRIKRNTTWLSYPLKICVFWPECV